LNGPNYETDLVVVSEADQRTIHGPAYYPMTREGIPHAVEMAARLAERYPGRPYLIQLVHVTVRGTMYESVGLFDILVRPGTTPDGFRQIENALQEEAKKISKRRTRPTLTVIEGGKGRRRKNADSDAFIAGEPIVYGSLSSPPRYLLAWSLESTPICNGSRDMRGEERTGSLRAILETGEVVDLDCDNFTPVRRAVLDEDLLREMVASCTPALQAELCHHYIASDDACDICKADPDETKCRMLSYSPRSR